MTRSSSDLSKFANIPVRDRRSSFRRAAGFTYLALLAAIVILGIMLGAAGKYWSHVMLREKEEELLFRGDQYVRAIESYYLKPPGGLQPILPPSIDELVKDSRFATRRHLRKKYKDPITGEDFAVIQDATKRIIGVKSTSDKEPLKKGNFPKGYETFQGKTKYSEWEFKFTPAPAPTTTTTPPPPPPPPP